MKLVDVYATAQGPSVLYALLAQREPHQNISHKAMPGWDEHLAFIASRPYAAWYLIRLGLDYVGAIYLSKQREVGLFIFEDHRGKGLGKAALSLLREKHPGRLLANINPRNTDSIRFFEREGFRLLQVTYELS